MKYKKILLKLSGEALGGESGNGISNTVIKQLSKEIKEVWELGTQIAIVIGGGNIHRGVAGANEGMDRTSSDHMGMLSTMINAIALQDNLERIGVNTRVMSAIEMNEIAEPYIRRRAMRHLEKRRVVIFGAGTGNPYFTTDTAAALRGSEVDVDIILKATKVDGVYDKDPMIHKDAIKYDQLDYMEVINQNLKVMDKTAITLCMENKLSISIFDVFNSGNIKRVVLGEKVGTIINNCK